MILGSGSGTLSSSRVQEAHWKHPLVECYFVETCINTSTHNGFVTKEFVKIDEDSQTQDYTIIYIKFQGQTPPFSTHNRDIFERVLPTPFPQVGDILSEEEDN